MFAYLSIKIHVSNLWQVSSPVIDRGDVMTQVTVPAPQEGNMHEHSELSLRKTLFVGLETESHRFC